MKLNMMAFYEGLMKGVADMVTDARVLQEVERMQQVGMPVGYQPAPYTPMQLYVDMRDTLEEWAGLTHITEEAALEIRSWLDAIDRRITRLKETGRDG